MSSRKYEKLQLPALVLAHFTTDMLTGVLPGILPGLRERFLLSPAEGTLLLAAMGLGSNVLQIPAGMLRKRATDPLFLKLGLLVTATVLCLFMLPAHTPLRFLLLPILLSGAGAALVHPEGLRGIVATGGVSPTMNTSLFMIAGFFGFAAGPLIGALLLKYFGGAGLLLLLIFPAAVIALLTLSKVKLAVKASDPPPPERTGRPAVHPWTFRQLFVMAVFINAGTAVLQGLLTSFLHARGFTAAFGGLSTMIFGVGSAVGALILGKLAAARRPSRLIIATLAGGIPLLLLYLALSGFRAAAWLAFPVGLLLGSGFPLITAMSHKAPGGLPLGTRMGMIVGGSWGIATAVLLLTGKIIEWAGFGAAMNLVWLCYLAGLLCAVFTRTLNRRREE